MGNSKIKLAKLIPETYVSAVDEFIDAWNNTRSTILAHTSGSTGTPKLIELPKSDMQLSAKATCDYFGINHNSTLVLPLSPKYIAGKMMIVRAIISGATLWIEEACNKPIAHDYGIIDLLPVVPSQVNWLIENPKLINSINNIIVGGGALSPDQESRLREHPCNIYATYGMTETCSHVALRNISRNEPYYTAMPDISFDIDHRGCLIIEAPKYSFKRLITNDIIELINSHQFVWRGRYDNVINTGGIKVFPEEIEQQLAGVIDSPFYIIGRPSPKWGEEIVLYVEGSSIDTNSIIKKVRNSLNPYCVPKEIIVKYQFFRTESGKIKRMLF